MEGGREKHDDDVATSFRRTDDDRARERKWGRRAAGRPAFDT